MAQDIITTGWDTYRECKPKISETELMSLSILQLTLNDLICYEKFVSKVETQITNYPKEYKQPILNEIVDLKFKLNKVKEDYLKERKIKC